MPVFNQPVKIGSLSQMPSVEAEASVYTRLNRNEYTCLPGFCDVHVHFREPGFSYKETIAAGSRAAARGGYTAVCTMPNLNPVPDTPETLRPQLDLIVRDGVTAVYPYGSITAEEKGIELSAIEALAPLVIGFSDDGRGVQDEGLMREAMQRCRAVGRIIAAHCEDLRFEDPREREWREVERNIRLADETGCALHICHVSTQESVSLIRDGKRSGVDLSCETAPHYLLLNDLLLADHGRFRMNPPIQTAADQGALIEAVLDGTVDMIATDHAPHSAEEKSRGFAGSLNGIVGLETAFPALYTVLVGENILTLEKLISLLSDNPRARFRIPAESGFSVWDLNAEYTIDPASFLSKGRSTPFEGWPVQGKCLLTVYNGKAIYIAEEN